MIKTEYNVIGVMSGTSLDGIDLAYVTFKYNNRWQFIIEHAVTIPYNQHWEQILPKLTSYSHEALQTIDKDYTVYLAKIIQEFINSYNITAIDAVCSHGHTALHAPQDGLTYQIGNRPEIANLLQETVVCNFRVQDVELGGQGAPLVPIGDALLFTDFDFCLNLGGFANVSTQVADKRIAYDICPVNIVLNHYVKQLGFDYDNKGEIAASGYVQDALLETLNTLEFYAKPHPKSLGLEWVEAEVLPVIDRFDCSIQDKLRTFVEHIAIQISSQLKASKTASVLVTGGGTFNKFLIDRLTYKTNHKIVIPEREIIEFKEALIFGFLGVLKLRDEINCLKSVTGAVSNHSSGQIYYA